MYFELSFHQVEIKFPAPHRAGVTCVVQVCLRSDSYFDQDMVQEIKV